MAPLAETSTYPCRILRTSFLDVDVKELSQKGGGFKTSLKVGGITGVEALGAGLPGLWVSG